MQWWWAFSFFSSSGFFARSVAESIIWREYSVCSPGHSSHILANTASFVHMFFNMRDPKNAQGCWGCFLSVLVVVGGTDPFQHLDDCGVSGEYGVIINGSSVHGLLNGQKSVVH